MTQATKQYLFEPNETNKKAMTLAKGRYQTDSACFNHIEVNSEPVDEVEYVYTPQYRVAETGRIYEVGGGLQSCSKAMKHAAFGDLEDVHNYDLRSSQAFGLIQQIEVIGVDDVWLRQYVKKPNLKYEYAEQVGISIECWKDCLYAIFFGACSYKAVKYGSIYKILLEEKDNDSKEAIAAYKKLLKILLPFRQSLGLWHAWLAKDYVDMNATWSNGHVISNAAGKSLNVTKLQQEAEELGDKGLVKRRIAAFILQGFESAFIHHLSHLADEYDYQVLSNQHDGLVTRGIIPREAILEAAKRSKLKYAYLEEKPFV